MGILKLGGLASGLDTEGVIKSLMTLERRPVVQLQKRADDLTTKAGAWRDLNQRLLSLQKRLEDIKSLAAATWDAKKATASDPAVLTATASATATPGTYNVEVTALARSTILQQGLMNNGTSNTPIADPATALNVAGRIQVATGTNTGKTFDIKATDSLNDIAKTINDQQAALGFSAGVIQVNPGDYRLVVTGATGSTSDFSLADDAASTAGATLRLVTGQNVRVDTAANAQAKVNGVPISSATNTFTNPIPGTTLTVQKSTTTPVTVTVSEDNSQVVGAVKSFVDQYNSVVDFMGQLTSYDSKTKKAGTLLGEDRLNSIEQTLRTQLLDPVTGVAADANSLANVGISTESFTAGKAVSGKLTFDQTKFTAALDKNPNAVRDLFTLNSGANKGLGVRATEWLDNYTKTGGILLGEASTIDKEITRMKDRIQVFDEQILPMREQRLRSQFTALEKAMSSFQNQGNWLSSQIKSLSPSR